MFHPQTQSSNISVCTTFLETNMLSCAKWMIRPWYYLHSLWTSVESYPLTLLQYCGKENIKFRFFSFSRKSFQARNGSILNTWRKSNIINEFLPYQESFYLLQCTRFYPGKTNTWVKYGSKRWREWTIFNCAVSLTFSNYLPCTYLGILPISGQKSIVSGFCNSLDFDTCPSVLAIRVFDSSSRILN